MADRPGHRQDLAAPKPAASTKNNTGKIIIACVALVLAGVVLAWNFGLFSSSRPKDTRSPDQRREIEKGFEKQEQLRQEMEKDDPVEIGLHSPTSLQQGLTPERVC